MCKAFELNKKSRELAKDRKLCDVCEDAISALTTISRELNGLKEEAIEDEESVISEKRGLVAFTVASMQATALMLCEAFGIKDEDVIKAGCELFELNEWLRCKDRTVKELEDFIDKKVEEKLKESEES